LHERLILFYESVDLRDLVEIVILTIFLYVVLRCLGTTRLWSMIRGLGLVIVALFVFAQVIIAAFDLPELAKVLDYLLTTLLIGMVVIFQPELRRGLLLLGRYRLLRYLVPEQHPMADRLADAAEALSRECVGALIAIERENSLTGFAETGELLDAELSAPLLRTLFVPRGPLHDGAVIISHGRILAAGCQLPLAHPPDGSDAHVGMRHRAALGLSEETDAVVLVVSEETGRISLAVAGRLEPVSRDNLSRRLAAVLNNSSLNLRGRAA
jgi:diadenylate cyclase